MKATTWTYVAKRCRASYTSDQQKEKVNYKELFAPVVKPTTLRTLLAGAAIKGWVVKQMDVTTSLRKRFLWRSFYLGLHIERDVEKRCMQVHQRKYLEALAATFGQKEESVGEEERRRFHSLVGSLMYAAVNTRPDVAFATGQLARVVQCPNEEQVAAGMRVAKYLGQTPTVGLQYSAAAQRRQKGADGVEPGHLFLTAFSDASYASEPEEMTSVGGFICCVGGGPTAWESKKQVDQALSSVESEYMALFRARVPLPSPPSSSLPDGPDPESDSLRSASPTITRFLATAVTDPLFESTAVSALVSELVDFAAACRLDYAASLVAESAFAFVCPPSVGGECALGTDVLEDRQEDLECFAAASPHLVSMLLAPEGDPDALDILTPRSYAEAIEGLYSSPWQAAMDAEMASWKSTGTYVDEVPPPGANIVSGMWIFTVKRPPGSPPAFKAHYVARGFSQRQGVDFFQTFSPTPKMTTLRVILHVAAQRDYELHSLDFSTTFLQGSLHEEIWLRRPPSFTGSFPAGSQWSLRRPVYGLRQAPREWHDTLKTTLAALGFALSTADPSLFLCTDTTLPPFYVLVYVDNLVFATADTDALAHLKSELQKRNTCTDLGELTSYLGLWITWDRAQRTITLTQSHMVQQVLQRFDFTYSLPQSTHLPTGHSLSAPPSDESVEPSGPYPELVGCLMYLMTCTRPDLAYPLSLLARFVAPGRRRKVHWNAAKRVLRYLCSTSSMRLVLGGWARVVLTGHADASSSCEAEIYAGAMAAHELRWLTYLLTDLGEAPRSPPVQYVDNKAMLALCQEHRLEHRTKHIALRYFLARELQQRGQLRLAYVASQANTADVFTKTLQPCDHQRFCTVLGLVPTVPQLLTS
ncbi:unnamed protein product [Closterium sp. NIES-53]